MSAAIDLRCCAALSLGPGSGAGTRSWMRNWKLSPRCIRTTGCGGAAPSPSSTQYRPSRPAFGAAPDLASAGVAEGGGRESELGRMKEMGTAAHDRQPRRAAPAPMRTDRRPAEAARQLKLTRAACSTPLMT
jgi:hypothetical protein